MSVVQMGHLPYGSVEQLTSAVYISRFLCSKILWLLRCTQGRTNNLVFLLSSGDLAAKVKAGTGKFLPRLSD